jgi:hypothetical protein
VFIAGVGLVGGDLPGDAIGGGANSVTAAAKGVRGFGVGVPLGGFRVGDEVLQADEEETGITGEVAEVKGGGAAFGGGGFLVAADFVKRHKGRAFCGGFGVHLD